MNAGGWNPAHYTHALRRDERDRQRLAALDRMVANFLDALAPLAEPLEHPDARWMPGDLIEALVATREDIAGEAKRLCGAAVLEPDRFPL